MLLHWSVACEESDISTQSAMDKDIFKPQMPRLGFGLAYVYFKLPNHLNFHNFQFSYFLLE